jgi:hypothetical protein
MTNQQIFCLLAGAGVSLISFLVGIWIARTMR